MDTNNLCNHIHKVHALRVQSFQAPRCIKTELQDSNDDDPTYNDLTLYHTETLEVGYEKKESEFRLKRILPAL